MNKKIKSLILSLGILIFGISSVFASSSTPAISIDGSGNVKIEKGNFLPYKYYKQYRIETGDSGVTVVREADLGTWDMCYLSYVSIAGEDKRIEDRGLCRVTITEMGENHNVSKGFDSSTRPRWLLRGEARELVNEVQCSAICMSFTTAATGN